MPLSLPIRLFVCVRCATALKLFSAPQQLVTRSDRCLDNLLSPQTGRSFSLSTSQAICHWLHLSVGHCLRRRTWAPKRATSASHSDLSGGASSEFPHLAQSSLLSSLHSGSVARSCKGANKSFTDSCMRRLRFLILPYHYARGLE